ncbi:MAG: hypothetical protein Fur0011_6460 [Candidatus Microgenomates bacterium]
MRKIIASLVITLSLIAYSYIKAYAVDTPNFPSCLSPQGTIRVFYPDGTHGIVGSSQEYVGSDTVYDLDESTLLQCFCSVDGTGIQTNWWNASSLSEEQVEVLKKEGWFYVPDGSLWGLVADPFVAKNVSYSCRNTPAPSPSSSSSNSSSSNSSSSNNSSTSEGDVLGLAATGDSIVLLALTVLALIFILAGLRQSRHEKN